MSRQRLARWDLIRLLVSAVIGSTLFGCRNKERLPMAHDAGAPDLGLALLRPRPPATSHSEEWIAGFLSQVADATASGFVPVSAAPSGEPTWDGHQRWHFASTALMPHDDGAAHGVFIAPSRAVLVHVFPVLNLQITAWDTCSITLVRVTRESPYAATSAEARESEVNDLARWLFNGEHKNPPWVFTTRGSKLPNELSTNASKPFRKSIVDANSRVDAWYDEGSILFLFYKADAQIIFPSCRPESSKDLIPPWHRNKAWSP